jgi:hypothetical protein
MEYSMPEQLELMEAAPDAALTPDATEQSAESNADATGGTENVAETEGTEGQQDGQENKNLVDAEKQKSERKISGIQKRLNELTRDKYSERQAREALERQNQELMSLLKTGRSPAADAPADGRPQQSQFTDYAEFVRADAVWNATNAAKAMMEQTIRAQGENAQRQTQAQAAAAEAAAYQSQAAALAKSIPDFAETMEDADTVDVPTPTLNMIRQLPNGALIAYHMIKNPVLAQQFFGKSEAMQGVLLGQLSASLKGSAKVSNAPPPGQPARAKAAGSSSEPPTDPDAYMAWAAKNMR